LLGKLRGGGGAEILLIKDRGGSAQARAWEAFVRPGRRLRPGAVVHVAEDLVVHVETGSLAEDGRRRVRLESANVDRALKRHGRMPLPPYVRRPATPADADRYQTVFAREPGSVAAPTAGLHFTTALFERLKDRGVETAEVVLHVGPGTFQPVKVDDVAQHTVAAESFDIPEETARSVRATRARGARVVAVGTTVVRTLETAALPDRTVARGPGETDLVVIPGRPFKVVDALVTNFHLPRSSLLLLVSAFAGRERVLAAYREAIQRGYRFYSYGDAMLIF
jgi:S-adenosylmethionine:tRNA ribosyltransferase-isomerase